MQSRQEVLHQVRQAIETYIDHMRQSNAHHEGSIRIAGDRFLDVLEAASTLQAELVVAGYELCGGKDTTMILGAARAIQMAHSTLHKEIAYTPTASIGLHAAEITLANLAAPAELRLKAVSITSRSLLLRAQADVAKNKNPNWDLLATEAVLNPLHVGMVLAGADCAATDAITPYALATGRLYVSQDDHYRREIQKTREQLVFWSSTDLQLVDDIIKTILVT